jgi:2-polyprenyl-3-methyl-5-hydroxy-6-metoxy-1,4-benzoquinol methylase
MLSQKNNLQTENNSVIKLKSSQENICKICSNCKGNKIYLTKEMLYGSKENFNYMKCSKCGCLQNLDIPKDLSRFYPSKYYSFRHENILKTFLRTQWAKYSYNKRNIIGWLIFLVIGEYTEITYLKKLNLTFNASILDVGCGMAHTLLTLSKMGFKNLTGIDPFINNSWKKKSINIYKKHITELESKFDLIILNWSFEHMNNQAEVLINCYRLLDKNGSIILRIPIIDSYAWKEFGINWFNLDPPRHLYIHSYKSLNIILKNAGLYIVNIYHEAKWLSLFHSDCYKKEISYIETLLFKNKLKILFNKFKNYKIYKNKIKYINKNKESDLVCFIIKKI